LKGKIKGKIKNNALSIKNGRATPKRLFGKKFEQPQEKRNGTSEKKVS
jgi:hypothetical protein